MADAAATPPVTTPPAAAPAAGEAAVDAPKFEVYKETKGWVKDTAGRFHEVDDVERFLLAYPGSEKVKSGDVVKSKVGYAEAKAEG